MIRHHSEEIQSYVLTLCLVLASVLSLAFVTVQPTHFLKDAYDKWVAIAYGGGEHKNEVIETD